MQKQINANQDLIDKITIENKELNEKYLNKENTIIENQKLIYKLEKERNILLDRLKKQDNLQEENQSLLNDLKILKEKDKISNAEDLIFENTNLQEENQSLLNDLKILKEKDKTSNAEDLIFENTNLKEENQSLLNEIKKLIEQENKNLSLQTMNLQDEISNVTAIPNLNENKNENFSYTRYALVFAVVVLLGYSIYQFYLNQKLIKQVDELSQQSQRTFNGSSTHGTNDTNLTGVKDIQLDSIENFDDIDFKRVDFSIINSITFKKIEIKDGNVARIERLYRVKLNEAASKINSKFHMSMEEFRRLNPSIGDINNIISGNFVKIYDKVQFKRYIVKSGESLSLIAKNHRMWSYEVKKLNDISNPELIKTDQRIIVFDSRFY